jgi:hypothetical protein
MWRIKIMPETVEARWSHAIWAILSGFCVPSYFLILFITDPAELRSDMAGVVLLGLFLVVLPFFFSLYVLAKRRDTVIRISDKDIVYGKKTIPFDRLKRFGVRVQKNMHILQLDWGEGDTFEINLYNYPRAQQLLVLDKIRAVKPEAEEPKP